VSAARATRPAVPAVPARRRPTTWLALALLALALGMVGFMFVSAMLPGHEVLSIGVDGIGDLVYVIPTLVAFLALPAVGALLASLRPHNAVGWVLLVGGVALGLGDFTLAYVERSVIVGPELPGYQLLDWLSPAFATLAFPLLTVWLPLLFPDGRLPGPRWRVVGLVAVINGVVAVVATLLAPQDGEYGRLLPNRGTIGGEVTALAEFLTGATMLISAGLIAAGVASVVQRFRRSRTTERQQMKWFVAAVALLASMMLVLAALQNAWTWNLMMIALAFLPIAIGIAVLRYRLYDIDRLISRTVGWALVTGILAAVFAGVVIGLQALLAGFTQGETLAVAASTLVAFALFQPLRRRIQVAVDRRFDRARYDGQQLAGAFAERLRGEVELEAVTNDLRTTAVGSVNPDRAGLWLRRSAS